MLDAENIRQTLQVWSGNDHLMELLSRGWDVEFPDGNLAAALYHLKGVHIEPVGHSVRVTVVHPQLPLEFLVPRGAFQSVLGFQNWLFGLDPSEAAERIPYRARTVDVSWMEYS
jgi:hypothetical protein